MRTVILLSLIISFKLVSIAEGSQRFGITNLNISSDAKTVTLGAGLIGGPGSFEGKMEVYVELLNHGQTMMGCYQYITEKVSLPYRGANMFHIPVKPECMKFTKVKGAVTKVFDQQNKQIANNSIDFSSKIAERNLATCDLYTTSNLYFDEFKTAPLTACPASTFYSNSKDAVEKICRESGGRAEYTATFASCEATDARVLAGPACEKTLGPVRSSTHGPGRRSEVNKDPNCVEKFSNQAWKATTSFRCVGLCKASKPISFSYAFDSATKTIRTIQMGRNNGVAEPGL